MNEKLAEIEELGRFQFSQSEIAIIIDIEESKFTEPMIEARQKGRLIASSEVRKAILKQAINGSTPAQKQMMDLINSDSVAKDKPKRPVSLSDLTKSV